MAKNNCCKICGRLDFDDDGDFLICRVCGEKRSKRTIPTGKLILSILFFFVSILGVPFVVRVNFYRDRYLSRGIMFWRTEVYPSLATYFTCLIEDHLLWVGPLLIVLDIAMLVAAFWLAKKTLNEYSKKIIV